MISSDQIIAAASTDRHLRLYDDRVGESGVKVGVKSTLSFHAGWISCVKFNPLNPLQVSGMSNLLPSYHFKTKIF